MISRKNTLPLFFLSILFVVLILDSRHALLYAQDGMLLCLKTVIPSLFPMFVITGYLMKMLNGKEAAITRPIERITGMPEGTGMILVLGLLGGYPLGAKLIEEQRQNNAISLVDARRMMGFCSNPGPAFLFGICGTFFSSPRIPFILWAIVILSALFTGLLLPRNPEIAVRSVHKQTGNTQSTVLLDALKSMAIISGWIILFRVLLGFLNRWILWVLPLVPRVILSGFLELSNGCLTLQQIENVPVRFLVASGLLSAGGLCIGMQTKGISAELGWYIPGKLIQTLISVSLAVMLLPVAVPDSISPKLHFSLTLGTLLVALITAMILKKVVAFKENLLYNN